MRKVLIFILLVSSSKVAFNQYYYKDLIALNQSSREWQTYKTNKISAVKLSSFESDMQPTEGFQVEQKVNNEEGSITTSTKTIANGSSQLISFFNKTGQLVKVTDTSDDFYSESNYIYDSLGRIRLINNTSRSASQLTSSEIHQWQYDREGKPAQMLRIRNGNDSTLYTFIFDEKENVAEEHGLRAGQGEPTTYYYYDGQQRLTDIVRYSVRAAKLLPTNMFSYNASGNLAGMLLVPEGSNEYQRWYYDYDARGLKIRERAYDKKQQLLGTIEYKYE